ASPIVGAVVSRTVMVWVRDTLVLPQSSIACQVLLSVYVAARLPAVGVGHSGAIVALLLASLAVGAVKVGEAGHSTVPLAPASPIGGAVVSLTVMVWVRETLVFPQASTACQDLLSV